MLNLNAMLYSTELLFAVIVVSFVIKVYLLQLLIPSGFKRLTIKHPWMFLLGTLIGTLFGDFAWIVKLLREMQIVDFSYTTLVFFIRLSWAFLILQYQSLSLFLECLIVKRFSFNLRHKIFSSISVMMSCYFCGLALSNSGLIHEENRSIAMSASLWTLESSPEACMMNLIIYYSLFLLIIPSIIITFFKIQKTYLPVIVKHQLSILLKFLISSYLFVEILQATSFLFSSSIMYIYPTVSISTLILSYAIYYSVKKVLGIRFLNVNNHVQSKPNIDLIHNFKNVLEQLSHVTSIQEVCQISQTFFKETFDIPLRKAQLYVRTHETTDPTQEKNKTTIESLVENFLNKQNSTIRRHMQESKILIYDELDFTNFYQDNVTTQTLLTFLQNLDADIFLPIYEKKNIIAYIVIDRHPRKKELYGNIERDEMIVFASYLCNIINLLQTRNLKSLIQQEKELNDELYHLRQEIIQYKESVRSFIFNHQKHIGIIFYKHRRFSFGNQAAKELIGVNLNTQNGHPLTKVCKQIVQQVTEYKTAQTVLTTDEKGDNLVLSAVPNLEQNNIIMLVHYPEMSDMVTKDINLLQDPTKWDYLLYLQATKSGQLINQLVPGTGETLLNFKINLLQTALSKKATLLMLPDEDLLPTVELLHHLSSRESLHILNLEKTCTDHTVSIELFGINPVFGMQNQSTPIMKKLGQNGTIFIKNIHFLDLETQEYLAELIKYGHYRVYKSEQRITSNVRIICSTDQNLMSLMQEGIFSRNLFHLLNKMTLHMSSLETLSKKELDSLADGLTEQAIKTADFKNMLELSEKEKMKLAYNRPTSLQDMRIQIEKLLVKKSKKNHIFQETHFDPAYHITDPELTEAARLGKHALRDQQIMSLLWSKFYNQNKIAAFLGVNRSSVNRRCKQFNLE
ncbi:MAG: sigma 54-interacting transcriptional regulator [Candidatus Dependentiae bacterium]